jgi:hypothetical protein
MLVLFRKRTSANKTEIWAVFAAKNRHRCGSGDFEKQLGKYSNWPFCWLLFSLLVSSPVAGYIRVIVIFQVSCGLAWACVLVSSAVLIYVRLLVL